VRTSKNSKLKTDLQASGIRHCKELVMAA